MSTLSVDTPFWLVVLYMFMVGIGFGPSQSIFALASQNAVEPRKIGQATSAIQFNRQIGSVVCAAVLGVVFNGTLVAALPKHGVDISQAPGGQGSSLGDGPEEIRAVIVSSFDATIARFDRLFTLRGTEAKMALDGILADPALPAKYKDELKAGTPAMRIDAAFDSLIAAIAKGDLATLSRLLDPRAVDPSGRPGIGANMPAFVGPMLLELASAPTAVRQARLPAVRAEILSQKAGIEDAASAAASKVVHDALESEKVRVADRTVAGMKASFADGVVKVWFYGIFLMIALLVAVLMIPNLKLKGKADAAPPAEASAG